MRFILQTTLAVGLLATPAVAHARGGGLATYHAPPCSGDTCKADDPRANSDCQGWLCSISSAKAMQRPVTAAEAEAAAKAQAAAAQAQVTPAPVAPAPAATKRKRVVKLKTKAAPAGADTPAAISHVSAQDISRKDISRNNTASTDTASKVTPTK